MNFWTRPRNKIPAKKLWIFGLSAFMIWAVLYAFYIASAIRDMQVHAQHVINMLHHLTVQPPQENI